MQNIKNPDQSIDSCVLSIQKLDKFKKAKITK